eukprot:175-Pelagomonas_calceolata.AAC.1
MARLVEGVGSIDRHTHTQEDCVESGLGSLYIKYGKGDTLAQKCRESPPPQSYETESANGDLKGFWKHLAPEPGCKKYYCFQGKGGDIEQGEWGFWLGRCLQLLLHKGGCGAQHLIEDQRSCPRSYPSLSANQQRMHFIESKYCEDRRPEQLVEAAQRQHAEICQNVSGKAVALHTILLGVGGTSFL